MMIKHTDLNLHFTIEHTNFIALNLVYERFLRSIPSHSHSSDSYEIHYVPYGYGTAVIDGASYPIVPNTLYITGPYVEHAQEPLKSDPMVEYCIYLKTGKTRSSTASPPAQSISGAFLATDFWFGQDLQNMLPLMQQLFFELDTRPSGYLIQAEALLQQCIVKIIRNYENALPLHKKQGSQRFFEHPNLYDQKYIILEECFLYEYQEITLEKLAGRLGLGIRQTERLLEKHYGKTFLQKKTEAKMSAAVILLKDSSKSITAVSLELGYSTVEHFSNAFKRYYHISPRDYRKEMLSVS